MLYVLDEPSIGLHQRDNDRLLATLQRLRDLGNTVLVVEHDEDAIRHADYLIDMGPAAGIHGGHVVAKGTPAEVMRSDSLTAQYLSGRKEIPVPGERRPGFGKEAKLRIVGARHNNLKNVTAEMPLGVFTCVTGVSGGGKSTLVIETLYNALARSACTMRAPHPAIMTRSRASSISTRSSTSTSRRSAARRARTPRPIPAPSRRSATGSPACRKPRCAATRPAASPST